MWAQQRRQRRLRKSKIFKSASKISSLHPLEICESKPKSKPSAEEGARIETQKCYSSLIISNLFKPGEINELRDGLTGILLTASCW